MMKKLKSGVAAAAEITALLVYFQLYRVAVWLRRRK